MQERERSHRLPRLGKVFCILYLPLGKVVSSSQVKTHHPTLDVLEDGDRLAEQPSFTSELFQMRANDKSNEREP